MFVSFDGYYVSIRFAELGLGIPWLLALVLVVLCSSSVCNLTWVFGVP